jgi:Fic family protein
LQGSRSKIKTTRDLKEIMNYSKARKLLDEVALKNTKLDPNLILKVHDVLMQGIVTGKLKGHYRNAQNIIKDASTGKIVYLPPEFEEVPALMQDLVIWVERSLAERTSALLVAAIFHYRFVTIHPFMDGNGRAARLITNYILLRANSTVGRYAAIEKQHEHDRKSYYLELKKLQAHNFYDIPEGINITSWIEYWLTCMHKTYKEALNRVRKTEPNDTDTMLMEPRLQKAVSLFRKHKKLKASEYGLIMGVARTQAVEDLNTLVEAGIIIKTGGGRSSVYQVKK